MSKKNENEKNKNRNIFEKPLTHEKKPETNPFLTNMQFTCGLVLRASEREFVKLLENIHKDSPRVHIIYQKVSVAPLWIQKGYPNDKGN